MRARRSRWPQRLSLRLRLTLLFAGLALLTVLAAQVLSSLIISARLHEVIDQQARSEVSEYRRSVRGATSLPELEGSSKAFMAGHEESSVGNGALYRISFSDGTVLVNTSDQTLSNALGVARPGTSTPVTVTAGRLGSLRVVAIPIRLNGHAVGTFRAGLPLTVVDSTPGDLALPMFLAGLAIISIGMGLAYFLVDRGLEPIRRITDTARAISEEDMSRRIGPVGPGDDVTQLAATFDAMIARLDAGFRQQRDFFTLASHELRTPLTIAQGHLQILRRQPSVDPEELQETLDVALDEIGRVTDLVSDLVMLGRVAQGGLGPVTEVDLGDLLQEIHHKARVLAPRDWRLRGRDGAEVMANPEQLTRALLNLISNAVRHTAEGDRIEIGCAAQDGDYLISVSNSGEAIPEEDLPSIFEPWYRGRTAASGGAGLGLAIVRAVALAHGGRVDVRSIPGSGVTFTIRLPARS